MFWEGEIIIYLYVICILTHGKRVRCNDDKHVAAAAIYIIKEDAHPCTLHINHIYVYVEKEDAQMMQENMQKSSHVPNLISGSYLRFSADKNLVAYLS